jgi:hypothetical protein
MRPSKHLAITIATLTLTAITTATAQAAATLPNLLPTAGPGTTEIISATTSSGKSTFGNGILEISSSTSKGTATMNALKLGSFDALLENTKSVLGPVCTGLSDTTKGSILILGTFHLRDYKEGTNLRIADIILLLPVHFECEGGILVVVLGCLAGALTPENVLTKTLTNSYVKNGTRNDNVIITVLNETNTAEEACQLLASENSGTFKLSNFVSTQIVSGMKQNGAEITVLLMPL